MIALARRPRARVCTTVYVLPAAETMALVAAAPSGAEMTLYYVMSESNAHMLQRNGELNPKVPQPVCFRQSRRCSGVFSSSCMMLMGKPGRAQTAKEREAFGMRTTPSAAQQRAEWWERDVRDRPTEYAMFRMDLTVPGIVWLFQKGLLVWFAENHYHYHGSLKLRMEVEAGHAYVSFAVALAGPAVLCANSALLRVAFIRTSWSTSGRYTRCLLREARAS